MKIKLYTTVACAAAIALAACTSATKTEWTHEQKKSMRRALHEYRDMVYLDEMTDAEFTIFSGDVIDEVESVYPLYTSLLAIPALSDTIDMYVTTTIVEQLDADGNNMRHIYPYRELKRDGRLPSGLDKKQRRAFYKCLARKIDNRYSSFDNFFFAVAADTTDTSAIGSMQAACAKELFNFTPDETKK